MRLLRVSMYLNSTHNVSASLNPSAIWLTSPLVVTRTLVTPSLQNLLHATITTTGASLNVEMRYGGVHSWRDSDTNWVKHTHIDGGSYYYHPSLRIITGDDMDNNEKRQSMIDIRNEFMDVLVTDGILRRLPQDVVSIITLDDFDVDQSTVVLLSYEAQSVIKCAEGGPDIEYETRTSSYWDYLESYPMHIRRIPRDTCLDFLSALSHGATESNMDNQDTAFPFTDTQIQRLIQIYDDLADTARTNPCMIPALIWHVSRAMCKIEGVRERQRRKAKITVGFDYLPPEVEMVPKTWLLRVAEGILMILLLGSFKLYWKRLQSVRQYNSVHLRKFHAMLDEFLSEWSDSNLLATVFVGANLAFIAVPNTTSLQRTASLGSAIFAVLSIASGLYHLWHHRTKVNADITEACKYMSHVRESEDNIRDSSDLLITASFLSVPIASLLWAVIAFTVAVSAFCIQGTNKIGRIFLMTVLGVLLLVGCTTLTFFWRVWRAKVHFRSWFRRKLS